MEDLFNKYFEGLLTPQQEERLFREIRDSAQTAAEFRNAQVNYIRDHAITEHQFASISSVRSRIKRENAAKTFAGVAAVCAFIVSTVLFLTNVPASTIAATEDCVAETVTIDVPNGSRMKVHLSDGTGVWLNSGSTLSYDPDFNKTGRNVFLNGEGYFEVAHNPEKPFVVHTSDCNYTVLGTCFNIYAYEGEKESQAALLQGSLRVDAGNLSVTLSPDQMASFKNGRISTRHVDSKQYITWMKGKITYNEISLSMLVGKLSRLYDKQIVISSTNLDSRKLRVSFSGGDSLESIFKSISELLPVKVRKVSEDVYRIEEI